MRITEGQYRPPSVNAPNPAPTPPASPAPSQPAQAAPQANGGLPPAAATDPGVAAAAALAARIRAQANAALRAARSQALIQFGDPSLLKGLGFSVDPSVLAAAKANQYSFVHQLGDADTNRRHAELNSLAAHGILYSGETGYQSGQEDKWKGQQLYGAEQSLLANLGGYLQDYLNQQNNADSGYNSALQNWWQNYLNNPDAYPSAPAQSNGSAVPPWWEPGWGNYGSST